MYGKKIYYIRNSHPLPAITRYVHLGIIYQTFYEIKFWFKAAYGTYEILTKHYAFLHKTRYGLMV